MWRDTIGENDWWTLCFSTWDCYYQKKKVHGIVVYQLIYFFNGFTEMEHGRLAVNGKVVIMAGKE